MAAIDTREEILSVRELSISFRQYEQGFRRAALPVIRDLSVTVRAGELVAVVGSSGSGKSLLAHGILGILPYNASMAGEIRYTGEILTPARQKKLRGKEIVLVPQSITYLDPLMKVGAQVRNGRRDAASRDRVAEIFAGYGLDDAVQEQYPFELSGGMTRRVLISTAVMTPPRLVIADEPTPGLHIRIARRVLSQFRELADAGAGVLLITHDLELALEVADRVAVFYAGATIEDAAVADFAAEETLRHPYTRALWRAMPDHAFEAIPGIQPYAKDLPEGCLFAPRCPLAAEDCRHPIPWRPVGDGFVRCIRDLQEVAR
jgi:peptide/nickel transport system ATP-binding protein